MKKIIVLIIFSLLICITINAQPNNISKEQKVYELSVFWKELCYNFANFDQCPTLNVDSLYRVYFSRVAETQNDYDYYLEMQGFAAHFNNGHTFCSLPQSLFPYLCTTSLRTKYDNGKVYMSNIGLHNKGAENIQAGDEIVKINGLPAVEYFNRFAVPYVSCSNPENKLQESMFSPYSQCPNRFALVSDNRHLILEVMTEKGLRQVTVDFDIYFMPNERQKEHQNNIKWLDTASHHSKHVDFMLIPEEKAAYLRLDNCDEQMAKTFFSYWPQIAEQKYFILDLRENLGGDGNAYSSIIPCLLKEDSLSYSWYGMAKTHNSAKKAWGMAKKLYYDDSEVDEWFKFNYYPYTDGTAFDTVINPNYQPNPTPKSDRFKGMILVLIGPHTASAAEGLAITLSQGENVKLVGSKTAGANGQPLVIPLESGINLFINSFKSFDFEGQDFSAGINPDMTFEFEKDSVPELVRKLIHRHAKYH